jgi:hypothetical protein
MRHSRKSILLGVLFHAERLNAGAVVGAASSIMSRLII